MRTQLLRKPRKTVAVSGAPPQVSADSFTVRRRGGTLEVAPRSVLPKLIVSAAHAWQFPPEPEDKWPLEVAFLGRSNVGKSSLLNALVEQRDLAFTSSKPGCTQLINFFRIHDDLRFVDMPGYGYARVSIEEKARWRKLIESYLLRRQNLALSFLLIDARRGWMDMDLELKSWLEFHNRRYQVIVTKIDKLKSNNQLKTALTTIRKQLADQEPLPFSAMDGRGVRETWQIISKIKNKQ
ncbi:MAG: YihA family ribosome biogenesis GTP-binding protein [Acidobacteriaceae bacterium]|nr:YihA family ribosome biogenesis GTP-binding protein [Acidobacteriaceae bacterium]